MDEVLDGVSPVQDYLLDIHINVNFNEWRNADVSLDNFPDYIRSAPFVFTIMNRLLTECKFGQERERSIQNFASIFMSQPLPHSLLPLETHRII